MLERLRSTVAPTTTTQEPASDAIDLRQVQDFFWRRWKLILSTAAVVAAVTYIALLAVTPRYTATVQVLLDPGNQKLLGAANLIPELSLDSGNVDSQLSLISSTNLLRRVVEQTKLTQDPEFGASAQPGLFSLLTSWLSTKQDVEPAPASSKRCYSAGCSKCDQEFAQRTRGYPRAAHLCDLDCRDVARSCQSRVLANAVADAYVVDQLDARYDAAKTASNWLAQRMEGMREQVQTIGGSGRTTFVESMVSSPPPAKAS